MQSNAPSSEISFCQGRAPGHPEWLPAISQAGQLRRGREPPQPRLTFLWRRRNVREVSKLPVLPAHEHEEEKETPQPAAYLPRAQEQPPSHQLPLFPATRTEMRFWKNTPCHHTVHHTGRHTGARGPEVRHTLNTPDTAGPNLVRASWPPCPSGPSPHALWRNSDRLAFFLRPHSVLKSGLSAVWGELGPPV